MPSLQIPVYVGLNPEFYELLFAISVLQTNIHINITKISNVMSNNVSQSNILQYTNYPITTLK